MLSNVSAVATGDVHTCAITQGNVKCWGRNTERQLGDATSTLPLSPPSNHLLANALKLATKGSHICAITTTGVIRSARTEGDDDALDSLVGRLGNGATQNANAPVSVTGFVP